MFTPEMIRNFVDCAGRITEPLVGTEGYTPAFDKAISDMCNEVIKHIKPEGKTFTQKQLEIVRDSLLTEYVQLIAHEAMVLKMRTLPVYAEDLLVEAVNNAQSAQRLSELDILFKDLCGVRPQIKVEDFAQVEAEPHSKMLMLAISPVKMQQTLEKAVRIMQEIPVMVNGERVVN